MKIESFKLKDGGFGGVEAKIIEYVNKNGVTVVDTVKRIRNVSVPYDLIKMISGLRPHFVLLSGIGESLEEYHEDVVDISGVNIKPNGGYVITGKINGEYGTVSVSTPHIDEESEYDEFDDMVKKVDEICSGFIKYFDDNKIDIASAKKMLIEMNKQDMSEVSRINSMTEDELLDDYKEKLQEKGYIVIDEKDVEVEEEKISKIEVDDLR